MGGQTDLLTSFHLPNKANGHHKRQGAYRNNLAQNVETLGSHKGPEAPTEETRADEVHFILLKVSLPLK